MKLGVNIDHVATLRQARQEGMPDILEAAQAAEKAGADSIVVHLREDRRHIQDEDVRILRQKAATRLNLEMSVYPEIVKIASEIKPEQATLVPEKRAELTTEGGLDVASNEEGIKKVIDELKRHGIIVSLFIDPDISQIDAALRVGAGMIELHTGEYANVASGKHVKKQLSRLKKAAAHAQKIGLEVAAGHGLNYDNVKDVAAIEAVKELNIGFAIIARAVFAGLEQAVREMKELIQVGLL